MKTKPSKKTLLKAILIAISVGVAVALLLLLIIKNIRLSLVAGAFFTVYYFVLLVLGKYEQKRWWLALIISLCMSAVSLITMAFHTDVGTSDKISSFICFTVLYFPLILFCLDTQDKSKIIATNTRQSKEWKKYKKLDDIPNPTERETLAIKAAKWWSDKLNIYSDKESTGDTFADGILMLARSNTPDLTESTIDKFEVNLVRAISESTEKDLTLRTDYAPCGILWDLAKKLKISHNYFPQKFIMTISFDKNKIYVRHAHCPEWDEIE